MYDFVCVCPETLPAITKAFSIAPEGDYYEFGLYTGCTFWHAHRVAKRGTYFWGFDSFAGLPEPKGVDAETKEFKLGDYACSRAQVVANLKAAGVGSAKTKLIEGFYDQSLRFELIHNNGMESAAVVLIDCDLYASTILVLRFMTPLLQAGTVLLFDDYNCFGASNEKGERRAFAEFLTVNPQWTAETAFSFGWHGQAFVMRSV